MSEERIPLIDVNGDAGDAGGDGDNGIELTTFSSTTIDDGGGASNRWDMAETSFNGNDNEKTKAEKEVEEREREMDDAWKRIKRRYPNADTSKFIASIGEHTEVIVRSLKGKKYYIFNEVGQQSKELPKSIKVALGPPAEEVRKANETEITSRKEKVKELESEREGASSSERENIDRNISLQREQIDELERENEAIEERMSLRDKVKAIFKKYGFTAFAVLSAVGAVIGVIVSNLKNGLSKLGKGIGDGFKAIGKKLGEILPGMVGAIASFIFKTAGEAIGFLAKNAWLLIVAAVLYFVEKVKRNNK